eukprot:6479515-Amphidinium_carterae.2
MIHKLSWLPAQQQSEEVPVRRRTREPSQALCAPSVSHSLAVTKKLVRAAQFARYLHPKSDCLPCANEMHRIEWQSCCSIFWAETGQFPLGICFRSSLTVTVQDSSSSSL